MGVGATGRSAWPAILFSVIGVVHCSLYINKEIDIIITMWVDDLIIFGKDMASINDLKAQLNEEYEMKDLGELRYFLGIQVHRDRERKIIHISQSVYNRTILERYGM